MPQQKQLRWSQLKVGIISLSALVLLAVAIFLVTGQTGLFSKTMILRTFSPDAGGLQSGAVVRLSGVAVGNVRSVELSGRPGRDEAVEIIMQVNSSFAKDIRENSEVVLAAEGLLGER